MVKAMAFCMSDLIKTRVRQLLSSVVCKLYGLFVPRTIRTLDYSYHGWTIRTWTICTMDFSYHLYTILTTLTVGAKEFLQAVYQMQVDLGVRLVMVSLCVTAVLTCSVYARILQAE